MKTKIALIIVIYLSAQNFFNPFGLIPANIGKLSFYVFSLIGLLIAINIKNNSINYPRKYYKMVLLGIIISILSVWINYDQSLTVSVITTLPYFFSYIFFYILVKFSPNISIVFRFIKILVAISFFIFLANLITFPNVIFGAGKEEYDMSRGFARLGVPMIELVLLCFFYAVNKWVLSGKKKWLIWVGVTGFLVVFSLTRQIILCGFVFALLIILQKAKMWKKVMVVVSIVIFGMFVLPETPIYKSMMELSETQMDRNKYDEEDIRITAWRFYTIEYQANVLTRIVGNGMPSIGNSKVGNTFDAVTNSRYGGNGCYYVDVGWAGFYWLFGIFATAGLLLLLIKSLKKSLLINKIYLSYWILFIILTSVASAPIIYHFQVVSLSLILYIIFAYDNTRKIDSAYSSQL